MCFYGNQDPSSIKHLFISLYSKYQSLRFICLPIMNSPVFLSLDDIYCTINKNLFCTTRSKWKSNTNRCS